MTARQAPAGHRLRPISDAPAKSPGGQPVPEGEALAELLAEVVVLAGQRALFPGRLDEIAERAQEHQSVRRALRGNPAVSAGTEPQQLTGPPESTGPLDRPLTPGEALMRLFLDNADNGRNAANDELVAALRQRARQIQALADPRHYGVPRGKDREDSRP